MFQRKLDEDLRFHMFGESGRGGGEKFDLMIKYIFYCFTNIGKVLVHYKV